MSHLARPLVVHETHAYCSRCAEEYAVVTDGHTAVVNGDPAAEMNWSRSSVTPGVITAPCGYVSSRTGERCDGHVDVDLTTPYWTADAPMVALLVEFGQRVEA